MNRLGICTLLFSVVALQGCATLQLPDTPQRKALAAQVIADNSGAAPVHASKLDDGGLLVNGELEGRMFSMAFPPGWNAGDALIFAHGYSLPGSPTEIADNPLIKDASGGLLKYAYLQGYSVGVIAFDKAGLGVQTGAENMMRLQQYLQRIGAKRVYASGGSMGGNIVVSLVENHPHTFAGALTLCGADNSFIEVIGRLIDLRAVYDYYTAGTRYVLPGSHDLNHSALAVEPPWVLGWVQTPWRIIQLKRVFDPINALFEAADKDPASKEAQIIAKISAVTGWEQDVASFAFPLTTIALGMDDILATAGGNPYDNSSKVYDASGMDEQERTTLNQGIARLKADAQARAYLEQWHTASGRFDTPLLSLHNSIDSLVPYSQATEFSQRVAASGNQAQLTQLTVPPMRRPIPFSRLDGYMHCGFRPQQATAAWDELRHWVEEQQKPISGERP